MFLFTSFSFVLTCFAAASSSYVRVFTRFTVVVTRAILRPLVKQSSLTFYICNHSCVVLLCELIYAMKHMNVNFHTDINILYCLSKIVSINAYYITNRRPQPV